jgi:molybdopterin/thiamine biosynthesis adenylyltransferase
MELHRTAGLLDGEQVRSKKIVFLGLGSLGSLVLGNLAYPWKKIVLVDPDKLDEHNVERHLLGRRSLGKSKADEIAEWLVDRGINRDQIEAHTAYAEKVLPDHTDADLVVVNVDVRQVSDNINAWCHEHDIPALYGGIYPLGTGGEVIVIREPHDICYLCAAHFMGRGYEGHLNFNYGLDPLEQEAEQGNLKAVPALRWAISSVASDMADLALEILNGGTPQPQVLVHAHAWEPILTVGSGPELNALTGYILNQRDLGLIPNMKLTKNDRRYQVETTRSVLSLHLKRWEDCPLHTASVSANEI